MCIDPAEAGLYFGHAGAWYRPTAVDYERTAAVDRRELGRHLRCSKCLGRKTWCEEKPSGRYRCLPCRSRADKARREKRKLDQEKSKPGRNAELFCGKCGSRRVRWGQGSTARYACRTCERLRSQERRIKTNRVKETA